MTRMVSGLLLLIDVSFFLGSGYYLYFDKTHIGEADDLFSQYCIPFPKKGRKSTGMWADADNEAEEEIK